MLDTCIYYDGDDAENDTKIQIYRVVKNRPWLYRVYTVFYRGWCGLQLMMLDYLLRRRRCGKRYEKSNLQGGQKQTVVIPCLYRVLPWYGLQLSVLYRYNRTSNVRFGPTVGWKHPPTWWPTGARFLKPGPRADIYNIICEHDNQRTAH